MKSTINLFWIKTIQALNKSVLISKQLVDIFKRYKYLVRASGSLSSSATTDLNLLWVVKSEKCLYYCKTTSINDSISMVLEIGTSSEFPSRQSYLTLDGSICDQGVSLIIVELVS
jgi:hypothetical protein